MGYSAASRRMNDELLQKAIQCTAIHDVYLEECKSTFYNNFEPKVQDQKLSVQFKIGAGTFDNLTVGMDDNTEIKMLRVHVQTGARFLDSEFDNEKKPETIEKYIQAEITAKFVAEYRITCDDLSEEAIKEFSARNASFHVWPYWREFLHSMTGRMKLPEVVLPMFTLSKEKESSSEASSDKEGD